MRLWRRLADEQGIGLLELVLVLALMGVVTAGAFSVLNSGSRTLQATQAKVAALDDIRRGLERITKETRQALTIDASSTRSRLAMRTIISGQEHDVVYEASGEALLRTIDGGTPGPVVSGLTSAAVFCYDPSDCILAGPDSATPIVRISITVAPRAFAKGATSSLTTEVHPRNTLD